MVNSLRVYAYTLVAVASSRCDMSNECVCMCVCVGGVGIQVHYVQKDPCVLREGES